MPSSACVRASSWLAWPTVPRRRSCARDLRAQARPAALGTEHAKRPAECLHAVGETAQARAALEPRTADPIIDDLYDDLSVGASDADGRLGRSRVLGDVGEASATGSRQRPRSPPVGGPRGDALWAGSNRPVGKLSSRWVATAPMPSNIAVMAMASAPDTRSGGRPPGPATEDMRRSYGEHADADRVRDVAGR